MASRHHSLDYSEVKDVTQLVQDFEQHNAISVRVSFRVEMCGKAPGIVLIADAFDLPTATTGASLLASVSVRCLDTNLRHWVSAVTHLLFVLDAQLARNEMRGDAENRA